MSYRKVSVAVIGANGYTGMELLRLLHFHPEIEIKTITSESQKGRKLSDVYPQFNGLFDEEFVSLEEFDDKDVDLIFLALPHGTSMDFIRQYEGKARVIDLSGDFRLDSPEVYNEWYGSEHLSPEKLQESTYGLCELNRDSIKDSQLVANPGCYPTSAALALAPLIQHHLISDELIVIDSKSGVTGAGAKPSEKTHYTKVNDNFMAYGIGTHRHTPEIEQTINAITENHYKVQFTPHLLPVNRGILTTVYAKTDSFIEEGSLKTLFEEFYSGDTFVRVMDSAPTIKDVKATNFCNIFATYDKRTSQIIVVSVIDNLVKGAAGQAIQNMNIMFGFDETLGLSHIPVSI
jgi:N-acetyl-gamma-glutamyl-phosphate reductase